MKEAYNGAVNIYLGGIGGLGLLLGMKPLLPLPAYLTQLAIAVAVIGAGLLILVYKRERRSWPATLGLTALMGLFAFAVTFGVMRYIVTLPNRGPLFNF